MSRHKHHPRENPHLAQWLFLPTSSGPTIPCQGTVHHQQRQHTPQAAWESRIYQDIERADRLMTEGVPREQINQLIWDAACEEQDTIGIVTHKIVHLCDACAERVIHDTWRSTRRYRYHDGKDYRQRTLARQRPGNGTGRGRVSGATRDARGGVVRETQGRVD